MKTRVPKGVVSPGRTNQYSLADARRVCAKIIDDPRYLANVAQRALNGTLPAGVEMMLWYYRFGKPVERTEITVDTADLSNQTSEELAARAAALAKDLLEQSQLERASGEFAELLSRKDEDTPESLFYGVQ